MRHSEILDRRKSSIYKNRSRFSVFGIGSYSFAPWKIAISGLYKRICFVLVPPIEGRPVMVDDTCYSIPCQFKKEADLLLTLLSSTPANKFLSSLIFSDSKRPITIDLLRRLSFVALAKEQDSLDKLKEFTSLEPLYDKTETQLPLLMEPKQKYRTKQCNQYFTIHS